MTETAEKRTFTSNDLLDAYLDGRRAGAEAALRGEDIPDHDPGEDEPLTYDAVLEEFNRDSPSDVLRLPDAKPAELVRIFLDAADERQFIYRTTHADGWMMSILTTHGTVTVAATNSGSIKFHVPSPPLGSGSLDMRSQIIKVQGQYREDDKGWNLETGEQFGRWF